jgi:hypothetical protein
MVYIFLYRPYPNIIVPQSAGPARVQVLFFIFFHYSLAEV